MDIGTPESTKPKAAPEPAGGFLQNLFSSLFNSYSPDAEKRRKLKSIAKDFNKTKYHGFYKVSSGEMLPPFAKLFYDIYKIIYPGQTYIRTLQNPNIFKSQVINYSLSEQQVEILNQLSEESIIEKSKKMPLKDLRDFLNSSLEKFSAGFEGNNALKTENLYRAYMSFKDFCSFDFYFMLKKFTSTLHEGQFGAPPTFEKINAEYILEDLQDFITIIYSIPDDIEWDSFFAMLKAVRGDLVPAGTWKKIISKMRSLQSSRALEMIVKLIKKDPAIAPKFSLHSETIVDDFIEKTKADAMAVFSKLESTQKASKESSICAQIFGSPSVESLRNYTKANSSNLEKKDLNFYEYTEALSYLKEFLMNCVKKELRTYADLVVVRGQWDASLSAPFSNAYQDLVAVADQIVELDNSLAEDYGSGLKIKTLLPKIAHDPGAENIINRLVGDANEMAKSYIISSTQNLITIGKSIKQLLEDQKLSQPLLIANWKELERYSERPLYEFGVALYKKIYLFVQLMQICMTNASA